MAGITSIDVSFKFWSSDQNRLQTALEKEEKATELVEDEGGTPGGTPMVKKRCDSDQRKKGTIGKRKEEGGAVCVVLSIVSAAATGNPGGRTGVRIVVSGDRGTGKLSLIVTAAADTFPANVPPILPPTRLPEDFYRDRFSVTIIDTSSRVEDSGKVAEEWKRADAVVLTCACDKPETLDRFSTLWLPELRRLEIPEVFYYAQKAVLHPTGPLFDQESQTL